MYQKHKLICTGLSVFFAATHAGCAGSGLKNMFTRNETDGYHSLDELSVEERAVAEAEKSEDEEDDNEKEVTFAKEGADAGEEE